MLSENVGNKSGTCWKPNENMLGTCWEHVGTRWEHVGKLLGASHADGSEVCAWIGSGWKFSLCCLCCFELSYLTQMQLNSFRLWGIQLCSYNICLIVSTVFLFDNNDQNNKLFQLRQLPSMMWHFFCFKLPRVDWQEAGKHTQSSRKGIKGEQPF